MKLIVMIDFSPTQNIDIDTNHYSLSIEGIRVGEGFEIEAPPSLRSPHHLWYN